jgi:type I restriction enzyme S subunit
MKSSYKRLGDYIQELKVRNTDLKAEKLLGINIDKFFMPSVANIVGTDLSVYKIVKKNQFACNRMHVGRDYRLPVSMSKTDEEFIVSPAYDVFEIKDTEILYPDYLMMWFTRREFDRNAWFYTDADVRGGLHWKALCDMQLPIPHITKQREIVKEYNVIQNRIALNQRLIQKLEETAQTIYKQWFVDFEFPDENGLPYKSNGGEMVWCEELGKEIPKGWEVGKLGNLFDVINGYAFSSEDFATNGKFPIIKITNIVSPNIDLLSTQYYSGEIDNRLQKCLVKQDDILISMTGSHMNQINSAVGKIGRYNYEFSSLLNQRVGRLKPKIKCNEFVFQTMLQENIQKEILMSATGSANQANISPDTIKGVNLVIPKETVLNSYEGILLKLRQACSNNGKQNRKLTELKELLLSKLASIN